MDADGDGQISEREFVEGIGRTLKLTMPIMHARAVFQRIDLNSTGKLTYHKFIDWCQMVSSAQNFNIEELSNEDLLAILSQKQKNIFLAFEAIDINRDSRLSLHEVMISDAYVHTVHFLALQCCEWKYLQISGLYLNDFEYLFRLLNFFFSDAARSHENWSSNFFGTNEKTLLLSGWQLKWISRL